MPKTAQETSRVLTTREASPASIPAGRLDPVCPCANAGTNRLLCSAATSRYDLYCLRAVAPIKLKFIVAYRLGPSSRLRS